MNALKDPIKAPNPEEWCDRGIAATLLRVSPSTITRMGDDGRLTAHTIGSCTMYWRAEVKALAEARRHAGISRDE